MPVLETNEKVAKAKKALQEYDNAMEKRRAFDSVVNDRLSVLKNVVGATSNDATKIREEVIALIGQASVNGLYGE